MSALPRKLLQFLSDLDLITDRAERIDALISAAKRYRRVSESIASPPFDPAHRVPGCESQAYVWAIPRPDGTLDFHFAVENPQGISAMAMAVILGETLSGAPLAEVAEVPSDVVYQIFGNELSMGKSMGLMGMVTMVRAAAARRRDELAAGPGA